MHFLQCDLKCDDALDLIVTALYCILFGRVSCMIVIRSYVMADKYICGVKSTGIHFEVEV